MDTIYQSFRHVIEQDLELIKHYAMNRHLTDGPSVAEFYRMVSSRQETSFEKVGNDITAILSYFDALEGGILTASPLLDHVRRDLPLITLTNYITSSTTPDDRAVLEYALDSLDTPNTRIRISPKWAQYYE